MLDPVRFLSNVSTGHMGYELAREAKRRGCHVTLVSGPTGLKPPRGVHVTGVLTARQMQQAISKLWPRTNILFMTAAVCDYTPVRFSPSKIKRIERKTIRFKPTEDILQSMGKRKGNRILVGFALETENFLRNAARKLKAKRLDLVVLNWYRRGHNPFGANRTSMLLVDAHGRKKHLPRMSKTQSAREIVDETLKLRMAVKKGVKKG